MRSDRWDLLRGDPWTAGRERTALRAAPRPAGGPGKELRGAEIGEACGVPHSHPPGCCPRLQEVGGAGAGRGRAGAGPGRTLERTQPGGRGRADRASAAAGPAGGRDRRAAASMVLVLHHILIAVVQFLRRGQQVFLKPDEPPPPPQPCTDSLQVGRRPHHPQAGSDENGVSCHPEAEPWLVVPGLMAQPVLPRPLFPAQLLDGTADPAQSPPPTHAPFAIADLEPLGVGPGTCCPWMSGSPLPKSLNNMVASGTPGIPTKDHLDI